MAVRTRRDFLRVLGGVVPGLLWGGPGRAAETTSASLELRSLGDIGDGRVFDVCVIGSGPAGALLASSLVRHGVDTVVLESGTSAPGSGERLAQLDAYSTSGRTYALRTSRFRGIGGTSNLWTGSCTRLHPDDLAAENAYAPSGAEWPIRYPDLEPYYRQAEAEMSVRGADRNSFAPPRETPYPLPATERRVMLERFLSQADLALDSLPQSDFDGEPLRTRRTHLPAFSRSASGTLVPGCTVTRILPGEGGEVSGLRVQTLDGKVGTLRARRYVVACGVVETCRLLLLSRAPGFPDGIGIRSDLVGRCFMTHYVGATASASLRVPLDRTQILISRKFRAAAKERGLGGNQFRTMLLPREKGTAFHLVADMEMEPSPDNRITLHPKHKDWFGDPGAHLHLSASARDLATQRHVKKLVQDVASNLPVRRVSQADRLRCLSHHHMGGCRMGNDPLTSVVDSNLRVHGTPNLYVAGGAPFVTCGIAHPTLTIGALSLRLAEHLVAEG